MPKIFLTILIAIAITIAPSNIAWALRASMGGGFSVQKDPCVMKHWGIHDLYIYDRTVIYQCHHNGEVASEQFENVIKTFDRRRRLQTHTETKPHGEDSSLTYQKTYYTNGQLRSERVSGRYPSRHMNQTTYYYENGQTWQQWDADGVKIYDPSGNLKEHLTDMEEAQKFVYRQTALDSAENTLRDMAEASELYAQEHDGQHYPITPTSKNEVSGYKYDHTFSRCSGAYNYPTPIKCTNSPEGYEYKYIPDSDDPHAPRKILTITTNEKFSVEEIEDSP